ncbi:MAG: YegP family protein [Myxococcales bacterium]|nr:YegP family protein [Myxococcales bacterium]
MNRKFVSTVFAVLALASTPVLVGCEAEEPTVGEEQNATATKNAKIETFVGLDGQHYFNVIAGNGEKVLRSEGYSSADAAETGIEAVKDSGVDTESYDLLQAADGTWYFNLVAENGEIIGTSQMYSTKSNANRALKATREILAKVNRQEAAETGGASFNVFKGLDGKYYFNLKAANGEIVLASQAYTSKANAKKGVASIRDNGGDVANYEVRDAQNDQAYFVLKASNGKVIATGETYVSASNAERAIESISALVLSEKIADPK